MTLLRREFMAGARGSVWSRVLALRRRLQQLWSEVGGVLRDLAVVSSCLLLNVVLFVGEPDDFSPTGQGWFVLLLVLSGVGTAVVVHWRIDHGAYARVWVLGGLALYVVVLTVVGFEPCIGERVPFWTQLHGGLMMMTGETVTGTCATPPLMVQVAQYAAVGVLVAAALSLVLLLASDQVGRVQAHFASRVILVSGLEPESLPLIRSLLQNADECLVVIAEPDPNHDLVPQVRSPGAVVVPYAFSVRPADRKRLRKLLTHHRDQIALQRAYLLSSDDQQNVAFAEVLRSELHDLRIDLGILPPPRIIVRVDRYREGWHYVTEQLRDWTDNEDVTALVSALGRHQLTAQMLAHHIAEKGRPDHLLVVGDTDLAEAFCDEYAIQLAQARLLRDRFLSLDMTKDTTSKLEAREFQTRKSGRPAPVQVLSLPSELELRAVQQAHRRTSIVVTEELDEQSLARLEAIALTLDGDRIRLFVLDEATSGLARYPSPVLFWAVF